MRGNSLGPAQEKLLNKILDIQESGERVPTYQELAEMVGTTRSQVQVVIHRLITKGLLRCRTTPSGRTKTGTVEPTEKAWGGRSSQRNQDVPLIELVGVGETLPVGVAGTTAAGNPRNIDGDGTDEYMSLPKQHVRGPGVFLLEVAGDSMAGDGLRHGDHIIVDPNARWGDGDMLVVIDEGAATVKRLFRRGANFVLQPSNKDHKTITLRPGREHLGGQIIQGKVIGLVLWHVDPERLDNQANSLAVDR